MADGTITIATELDTKSFDRQIQAVEREIADLENQLSKSKELGFSSRDVDELNLKLEKAKNKLVQLNTQKNKLGDTKPVNDLGKSFENSIKKVGRLALAIFGIRSAYLAVRRASSDLAQYDEQYATNLEYIRYALTQAIAPVLRWIVEMAMKLLQVINMILNALFGVNLFANGSAENFQKMKKGASGVGKEVKEIKKQLLGFDEVNVLTSQSDSGTSAGAGGVGMPDLDLGDLSQRPEWLEWIVEHKGEILAILGGIVGAILAIKLGLGGIKALGIGLLITGIIYAVDSLIKYLDDPSWENFGNTLTGIGIALLGLAILIGNLPLAVIGAVVLILGIVTKYWDELKGVFQEGIDWLTNKSDWVRENFGDTIGDIYDFFVDMIQHVLNYFDSLFTAIKGIFDGIIQFIQGVFSGNWEEAWEGIKKIFISIWEGIKGTLQAAVGIIVDRIVMLGKAAIGVIAAAFKSVINGVIWAVETILNAPIRAINGLISTVNNIPRCKF